jgi:glyoxylate reductase
MCDGGDKVTLPYQVLVDEPLPAEILAMLAEDCTVHIRPADAARLEPLLASAEGLFTYGHPHVDGGLLDRMPRLRVISNFGVGV